MLRMESANQEIDGRPLPPLSESRANYRGAFGMLNTFAHEEIDSLIKIVS